MCGIIGYTGEMKAAPILLEGLSNLEYRGYDSAGIAVRNHKTGKIEMFKAKGRLKMLAEKTNNGEAVFGNCGIGHTRWATHGEPSEVNAHPHMSSDDSVILVHNGIIENFAELRDMLSKQGYTVRSQTDTEVASNLVSYYYKASGDPLKAISEAMLRIRGSFAFAILFNDIKDAIYVARKDSPLIVGIGEDGYYAASDVPAILSHTRKVYYINNYEMARITNDGVDFYNVDCEKIEKEIVEIVWDAAAAQKGGY
jgi:glucosamine--fructose-6-phosphate aminotransferase (isomerizing)